MSGDPIIRTHYYKFKIIQLGKTGLYLTNIYLASQVLVNIIVEIIAKNNNIFIESKNIINKRNKNVINQKMFLKILINIFVTRLFSKNF